MRLLGARLAGGLGCAVAAESWGAANLAVGHEDGSVSVYDKQLGLQLLWLNAGEAIASLTAVDQSLLAAFASGGLRLLCVDTGLVVGAAHLPVAVTGVRVLEHHIACWSRLVPKLWLLQRSNLDVCRCIDTESPVLNVLSASRGLSVVCSSHVYMLRLRDAPPRNAPFRNAALRNAAPRDGARDGARENELRLVLQVSSPFIAGTLVNHRWLLVRPTGWSLFSLPSAGDTLDEEFKVDAPDGVVFYDAVPTHLGSFLLGSTGTCVLVRDHNIQVIERPVRHEQGIWTGDAVVVSPNFAVNDARSVRGEIEWHARALPVPVSSTKYLAGHSDPSITADYNHTVGTADGKVNGVAVLPGPVLRIDAEHAYSPLGSVALPLQEVNIVSAPKQSDRLVDMRVSVQTLPYNGANGANGAGSANESGMELAGIATSEWAALRPRSAAPSATVLALSVLEGHESLDKILATLDISLTAVAQLEDLAVAAAGANNEPLGRTVALILDKVWTSRRVAELMQSAGPRSLQVLSAVYPYIDIAKGALQALVVSMFDGSRADREAVLWVYEHKADLVDDVAIPFAALWDMSEDTVARFAENMARQDSEKLLRDASAVMTAASSSRGPASSVPTASTTSSAISAISAGSAGPASTTGAVGTAPLLDDTPDSIAESNVMKVLLAALSSPGPPEFPPSDRALASLVALVAPAMHQRVPGAKKILAKLLSQSQVQYHQGKQRLLVPTPAEKSQAALVFEFNDTSHEPVVLQRPPNDPVRAGAGAGASTKPSAKPSAKPSTNTSTNNIVAEPSPGAQMMFSADGKSVHATTSRGKLVWHFGGTLRALFRSKHAIEPVVEH